MLAHSAVWVRRSIVGLMISAVTVIQASGEQWLLWYERPATAWTEALPLGNGRLGAMVFGGMEHERIQFNEDTLWFGEPHDYANPGAAEYLQPIRQLLFQGKRSEAESLAMQRFMSVPLRQTAYQPCGDLRIVFPAHAGGADYRRQLDLDRAVATVCYRVGEVTYTREVLASHPDNVIAVRLTADRPGSVSFRATLHSPHEDITLTAQGERRWVLRGRVRDRYPRHDRVIERPLRYEAHLHVDAQGGSQRTTAAGIEVEAADSAVLLLAAATNYVRFEDVRGDPAKRCAATIEKASKKSFDELFRAHAAGHQRLFRRASLDLGGGERDQLPTDVRIKQFDQGRDPQLAALYFQFGRYLMIAGSRPGTQPLNLQGIWNENLTPPWESKYTVNINTQMNYWPAEAANLAECHEPLFAALEEVAVSGRRTAQAHYNCRGWVLHHNFDLWRGTAPINHANHGIWPTGGAWLCQHLWWHYEFSGDRAFLQRAYPLLRDAALFFVDYLVEDPRSDARWLISGPSNSPEQGGLVMGPTMDHQIIRSLLNHTIQTAEILDVDADLRQTWREVHDRIAPNLIGRHGQLQEWLEDVDNPRNTHRHLSHLWGLFPGEEITLRGTPEIAEAAKTSLLHRGDGGTGWSMAWKVNLWARLEDAEKAYRMLSNLIAKSTLPNMFDNHPPFQIDGNFGGAAGIVEMLLQSHGGEITLLPALPAAWPTGSFSGLRARGGVEIDLTWNEGRAVEATFRTSLAGPLRLRPPRGQQIRRVQRDGASVAARAAADGPVVLDTVAGGTYRVWFE